MTIISDSTDLGGQVYPFLLRSPGWEIHTRSVCAEVEETAIPTLRWVKDDKICDLFIPHQTVDQFLALSGLTLSMHKGPYVLSKRISRIMRPYRYFQFFQPNDILIDHNPALNPVTWDGAGQISSRVIERIAQNLDPTHPYHELYLRELRHTRRFEITVMHDGGQEKGHVMVCDDLAVDIMFPAGSTKNEIALHDRVFVGLQPVHADENMRLDVQSLVNLHPFFRPEHLLAWMEQESSLFLQSIRSGEFEVLLSRLGRFTTEKDFSQFRSWWLAEYLLSGGSLMWFPGTIRAMARQHLNRLYKSANKFRFPVPGARAYILPDEVGDKDVPSGHAEFDPAFGTLWINREDWNSRIVNILGGCDGDDGVWLFPFTDYDSCKKMLIWRSPNQLGEFVILLPTKTSHTLTWRTPLKPVTWPRMDSRQLPPRIDTVTYSYGELSRFTGVTQNDYTIEAMTPAIEQAKSNKGCLGAYCNMLLLVKAIYGRLPDHLPARLEDVIDGTVKSFRDLTPVMAWVNMAAHTIVNSGKAVPEALRRRIEPSLSPKERRKLQFTNDHWIDVLVNATKHHIEVYQANLEALSMAAYSPTDIFRYGDTWREQGNELRAIYAESIGANHSPTLTAERCLKYLNTWPDNTAGVLLGAAAEALGDTRLSDSLFWQKEIAPLMLDALRHIGLIGEPMWTREGAAVYYDDPAETAVPVLFNGVWYNMLRTRCPDLPARMSDIPKAKRTQAKQRIKQLADRAFDNLRLFIRVTDEDRVVAYTENGNLFGYVATGQELHAVRRDCWQIVQARAKDGNVSAVLMPV